MYNFFKNQGYATSNKVGCNDAISMYINYFLHLQDTKSTAKMDGS